MIIKIFTPCITLLILHVIKTIIITVPVFKVLFYKPVISVLVSYFIARLTGFTASTVGLADTIIDMKINSKFSNKSVNSVG